MNVKGSTGKEGVIVITLDGFKVNGLEIEAERAPEASASSPSVPITAAMSRDELARALDGYLAPLAAADRFSGVVLVAKDGKPVFEKAYGFADRSNRVPNTMATRFNLGSINKIFTQVAIAQLAAQEKLAYAAPLSRFITDYPQEATRSATIEQLLTHKAGVANFFGQKFDAAPKATFRSNDDYYRLVSSEPPVFKPGEREQYCNGCYITLGEVIERVTGMSYEQYVAENVWKRADMTSTGYPMSDAIEPNVAMGYIRGRDGVMRSNIYTRGAAGSAAGGGYSTAADLLAFTMALRQGRLLDAQGTARLAGDGIGIAGGAPGINAIIESEGAWTVIVMSNFDPPSASSLGVAIARALRQAAKSPESSSRMRDASTSGVNGF